MFSRRRFKQLQSLSDRLAIFAKLMRERAETMGSTEEKAVALAKADQADRAAEIEKWISATELKPPE